MISLNSIELPADMRWQDEFDYSAVRQTQSYALSGTLVLQEGQRQAGRPITLTTGDDVWATRATVAALYALAQLPNNPLTLVLHEREFTVQFRHDAAAVTAVPVVPYAQPDSGDFYTLTLRLIEV
ncbi:MAG: hypothetical protein ACPGPF_00060 [Pontibacterium sp.]